MYQYHETCHMCLQRWGQETVSLTESTALMHLETASLALS